MATPTPVQRAEIRRLAIGDAANFDLLSDDDITSVFAAEGVGSVRLSAAACCELLAVRIGAEIAKWAADGQTYDPTMQPAALSQRAALLRSSAYITTATAPADLRPSFFARAPGGRGA